MNLPKPNDVGSAIAIYRDARERQRPRQEVVDLTHVLLRHQDDPHPLMDAIRKVDADFPPLTAD